MVGLPVPFPTSKKVASMRAQTLITGAAGFIGSHLTEHLLHQGHSVVALDNFCNFYPPAWKRDNLALASQNKRFTLAEIDIRNRQSVMNAVATYQPQIIVHLAALAGVRPSIERPSEYTEVNVNGTVHLLDAAVTHGCERFVFASSSSVYGNNPKVPFAENDPVDHPISPYAATKKSGELICHTYSHLHRLPIACLRFFTVYGPRQRPDLAISKFLNLIRHNEPIPVFGDGSTSRDYTFIDDIVAGICSSIDRCQAGHGCRIYNLGGKEPVTLNRLIKIIERVTDCTAKQEPQPMQLGDVVQTWADLTRSEAELDYYPGTDIESGIARQWQWSLQQDSR